MKKIADKRLVIILCAIVAAVAIFLILKSDKPDTEPVESTTSAVEEITTEDNTPEVQNGTKNPDKLIKITMPLSYFDAQKQCDTAGFFQKSSYENLKINEKEKTFTITIKSITHDFMLSNVGLQVIKGLGKAIDTGEYPYFTDLGKYNADFSEIELKVDAKAYSEAKDKEKFVEFVGGSCIFYQLYTTENNYKCTVSVIDKDSNEVIEEKIFKQDNKGFKS